LQKTYNLESSSQLAEIISIKVNESNFVKSKKLKNLFKFKAIKKLNYFNSTAELKPKIRAEISQIAE